MSVRAATISVSLGSVPNRFVSASNEKDQVNSTSTYLSTDRVVNVRKELLKGARPRGTLCVYYLYPADVFIHLQDSAGHVYVEVVLHGKKEGKFLEDPASYRNEMMGQVSKLGGFLRRVVKRETYHSPCQISSLLVPLRHRSRGAGIHWGVAVLHREGYR